MDQYDEFGNFIGDLSSDEDEGLDLQQEDEDEATGRPQAGPSTTTEHLEGFDEPDNADGMDVDDVAPLHNQIVLHEDKRYYPSAGDTYGEDVEAMVQEEDAQPLTEPIIAPVKQRSFRLVDKSEKGPVTRFDKDFLLDLANVPESMRNVAVVGHLHHGKTALLDMLVYETHKLDWDTERQLKYTDSHSLAISRNLSLKAGPMSLVMPTTKGKSHLINLIDTPGHVNFLDEVASAASLVDGAVLVVDAVEGVMLTTECVIKHFMDQKLPITVVINKVDRLILELRLPPADAYYKLKQTIEEINTVISNIDPAPQHRVSPEKGNVAFASTSMGWCFTLKSFAKMYKDTFGPIDLEAFAARLWGNIYYNPETRKFGKKPEGEVARSFVHFILEPLYKLYSQVLSEDSATLKHTLATLGITLKPAAYKMDVRPLLKLVLTEFFGPSTGLADMVVEHVPNPVENAPQKVAASFTGPLDSLMAKSMVACDSEGPTVIHVTKLFPTEDAQGFQAFGRVMSGTVKVGMQVKVLGEGYSPEDEEDMTTQQVQNVWVGESRYNIATDGMPAGSLVLLGGVDSSITKTATLVEARYPDDLHIFSPIKHMTSSVLKIAVEPVNPSELPKMLDGLRKINKTYPLVETRVEESGEHVIIGTGELYLDCIMHDLRRMFAEIEIKLSDPVTRFCETVVETSALKCYAETPNKKNKLTMISEPLEKGIARDIETGKVSIKMTPKQLGTHFQDQYQWDLLASRSIWAFGPDDQGANILMDDTLPSEVDKKLLGSCKDFLKQGFQWATREGPLCDEPVRNVKFRILDSVLAPEAIYRGGGQIIPTARRVCYSSMLTATPRLMEPVYYVEIQTPGEHIAAIYEVLARRRGHVIQDNPKPGSPLYTVKAYIPVIDANGFETDLRTHTQGAAFCLQLFDHWSIVPGDPTDKSIKLRPLEPSPAPHLARDFVLKTRRRKGLPDDLGVGKFFEPETLIALAGSDLDVLL